MRTIVEAACKATGCTIKEFRSQERYSRIVWARHMASWWLKSNTNMTLEDVAKITGGRDHASVLNSIRKVTDVLETGQGKYADYLVRFVSIISAKGTVSKDRKLVIKRGKLTATYYDGMFIINGKEYPAPSYTEGIIDIFNIIEQKQEV